MLLHTVCSLPCNMHSTSSLIEKLEGSPYSILTHTHTHTHWPCVMVYIYTVHGEGYGFLQVFSVTTILGHCLLVCIKFIDHRQNMGLPEVGKGVKGVRKGWYDCMGRTCSLTGHRTIQLCQHKNTASWLDSRVLLLRKVTYDSWELVTAKAPNHTVYLEVYSANVLPLYCLAA